MPQDPLGLAKLGYALGPRGRGARRALQENSRNSPAFVALRRGSPRDDGAWGVRRPSRPLAWKLGGGEGGETESGPAPGLGHGDNRVPVDTGVSTGRNSQFKAVTSSIRQQT